MLVHRNTLNDMPNWHSHRGGHWFKSSIAHHLFQWVSINLLHHAAVRKCQVSATLGEFRGYNSPYQCPGAARLQNDLGHVPDLLREAFQVAGKLESAYPNIFRHVFDEFLIDVHAKQRLAQRLRG